MKPPPALRRLTALVPAVLMVLASLSLAPTASADTSDDSLSYEFEIHENDVVDLTMTRKGDDAGSKSNCDPDDIENVFDDDDVKVSVKSGDGGNSCTVKVTGMSIKDNPLAEITHEDDSFTFEMPASSLQYYDQVTVKVTFPGSVSKVSGHGKKPGNTATWNNTQDETSTLTAKGADHASSHNTGDADHASSRDSEDNDANSPLPIIIVIVLVLATIGGVAAFIIIRQKRAKTGIALGYPQPGQQPYNPQQPYNSQPGYGQPGQAPGTAQPGYYAQPDAQQPYSPQSDYDQPGQQPRSPSRQH